MPGVSVVYPPNMEARYAELLAADGLDKDKLKSKHKDLTLAGDYRRLLGRAEDLSWETLTYTEPRANLQLTDFDVIRGQSLQAIRDNANANAAKGDGARAHPPSASPARAPCDRRRADGAARQTVPRRALLVAFTLRSSQYATMCIRELLKQVSPEAGPGTPRPACAPDSRGFGRSSPRRRLSGSASCQARRTRPPRRLRAPRAGPRRRRARGQRCRFLAAPGAREDSRWRAERRAAESPARCGARWRRRRGSGSNGIYRIYTGARRTPPSPNALRVRRPEGPTRQPQAPPTPAAPSSGTTSSGPPRAPPAALFPSNSSSTSYGFHASPSCRERVQLNAQLQSGNARSLAERTARWPAVIAFSCSCRQRTRARAPRATAATIPRSHIKSNAGGI